MTNWRVWKNRVCVALVLGFAAAHASAADPVLSFSASSNPATLGSPVVVSVNIANIVDLYGYNFSINFNPAVLQVTGTAEGPFLGAGGATFFDGGAVDNAAGTISFAFNTLLSAVPGVSGSGVLELISFSSFGVGTSALTFSDVTFLNSSLADIAVQAAAGTVQVISSTPAVPEPETYALMALGLVAVALARRRRAR